MPDVLVVFGSDSDAVVYRKLVKELKAKNLSVELRVLSAHRTPKELEEAVRESNAKLFIAGAGLSAALPGVIASLTIKPVIGIPVSGNYDGLDAFLSIAQMPPGIPVLVAGVEKTAVAADYAEAFLQGFEKACVVKRESAEARKRMEKCLGVLEGIGIKYTVEKEGSKCDSESLYIDFVEIDEKNFFPKKNTLYVPVKKNARIEDSEKAMKLAGKGGLWLGMGRAENAAIAAAEIINLKKNYSKALSRERISGRKKTLEADSNESS